MDSTRPYGLCQVCISACGFSLKPTKTVADQVTMQAIFFRLSRELRSLVMLSRLSSERGQTMAEYGILIAVIALVVVVAAITLGDNISSAFHNASTKV